MVACLLIVELLCKVTHLSNLVSAQKALFPNSGELNFKLDDPSICIEKVRRRYKDSMVECDETDGLSLKFKNWRFNLRKSKQESTAVKC